jgi:hypothetical protein
MGNPISRVHVVQHGLSLGHCPPSLWTAQQWLLGGGTEGRDSLLEGKEEVVREEEGEKGEGSEKERVGDEEEE